MSFGKMNGFADIVREKHTKDKAGFDKIRTRCLPRCVCTAKAGTASTRWANLAAVLDCHRPVPLSV